MTKLKEKLETENRLFFYGSLAYGHGRWNTFLQCVWYGLKHPEGAKTEQIWDNKYRQGILERVAEMCSPIAAETRGTLYAFPWGFPGATFDEDGRGIAGTLVTVPESAFKAVFNDVCQIEGYKPDNEANYFRPVVVEVCKTNGDVVKALSFAANMLELSKGCGKGTEIPGPRVIKKGSWVFEKHYYSSNNEAAFWAGAE